jgi:hypothetical protein
MRRRTLSAPLLLVLLALTPGTPAGDAKKSRPDPDLPYQAKKSNPVTYDVDFGVVVTAPHHTKLLKVWLPLPQTDSGQEVEEKGLSTFPTTVAPRIAREPVFGNKFAYFEFKNLEGAQIIRHRFKVKVWELRWEVDPARVVKVKSWPKGFDVYLRGERQAVVVDEKLRQAVRDMVPRRRGPLDDLAAVLAWVNKNVTYDHAHASLRASSQHLLKEKRGHCSDYHGFCAACARSLGYPTRVTYGINPFPKNSPSHCKLEAYLPPYGWVSFDVSETQNLQRAIRDSPNLGEQAKQRLVKAATDRLLHGFRDNTWFLQTRGTDYDLAPKASKRVPVVRTAYVEADGVPLPEPDPANPKKNEFSWMTVHKYTPDREVKYPFKDWNSLLPK